MQQHLADVRPCTLKCLIQQRFCQIETGGRVAQALPRLGASAPEILQGRQQDPNGEADNARDDARGQYGRRATAKDADQQGQGANASFHVVTFACVTITEVVLTGDDKHITCQLNRLSNVPVCLVGFGEPSNNLCGLCLVE